MPGNEYQLVVSFLYCS